MSGREGVGNTPIPVQVICGPDQHGVTEYARNLAAAMGVPKDRCVFAGNWRDLDVLPSEAIPAGPIHVTFTDHLFGEDPESAVDRVLRLARGRRLSVSFHDIPQPEEHNPHREPAYRRLARAAQLAVVNSEHEAAFFDSPVRVIRLPLPDVPAPPTEPEPRTVGVLGFIYPGKGHKELLDALSGHHVAVQGLGGYSAGHDWLAEVLREAAEAGGNSWNATGFLSDEDLTEAMRRVAVPVCAHRHFSASGSLMRWLAAGRRVLVSDSTYSREIASLYPDHVELVAHDRWADAVERALADPDFPLPLPTPEAPDWASQWRAAWRETLGGVSVIIPYYEDLASLRAVLAGLAEQTYEGPVQVIVADDGSSLPLATRDIEDLAPGVTVLRQEDRGFRAAAARNLGATSARYGTLAFLDGDTVPEPEYLAAAVGAAEADPRRLVVGARLNGSGAEAAWLREAYAETDHLRRADEASYRFVISAVLTCSRWLFDRAGGFDSSMVGYGGEDWEFAWRCWQAGALFHHEPGARAHHEEPDWHDRSSSSVAQKNRESVALARRISHPIARPDCVHFSRPDVVVRLELGEESRGIPGVVERTVAAWLPLGVVGVEPVPELFREDARVVTPDALPDARVEVRVLRPVAPRPDQLQDLDFSGPGTALGGALRWTTARSRALAELGVETPERTASLDFAVLNEPVRLEGYFGGWG